MLDESRIRESPRWFPLREAGGAETGSRAAGGIGIARGTESAGGTGSAGETAMSLVELTEAEYGSESFLDLRLLARGYEEVVCRREVLARAALSLKQRPHYILHIGHAGSTLVSRLIGAHEQCLSVREPHLLRALATAFGEDAGAAGRAPQPGASALPLDALLALLGRTWHPGQRAVVKATSVANEIAPLILAGEDHPAAIFMYVDALAYLRGILAGPNSRVEARALAPARLRRLQRRLPDNGDEWHRGTEGELIAMSWLCEMTSLHEAWAKFGSQVRWVNFDQFLSTPAPQLSQVFGALGFEVPARTVEELIAGPLMRRYSKAPEHPYDAALRREVLACADWEHGEEIKRGMALLHSLARRHSLAPEVLDLGIP